MADPPQQGVGRARHAASRLNDTHKARVFPALTRKAA